MHRASTLCITLHGHGHGHGTWCIASRLRYLAAQLQLEASLSAEDIAALAEGAEAFLSMDVSLDVGNNKDKLRLAAARAGGGGGGGSGGLGSGRSKFEVLEDELDKESRKVDKKARRQAEREAQDSREVVTVQEAEEVLREQRRHGMTTGEMQQVRRFEARRAAEQQAPDEEDGEALELELAQTHTTAKARPKGGTRREKAVSEKELREMSAKQLKRLLERERVTVPNDVRQGRTASGDHELALRNFALKMLVRPREELEEEDDALIEEALAQKRREEGSGFVGVAAGLVRRVGDAFTFGKATAAAAAAATAGTAAANDGDGHGGGDGGGGGGGGGDGAARSSGSTGRLEAQDAGGAGGAAGAEAKRQARKRELRAKLKEKQRS